MHHRVPFSPMSAVSPSVPSRPTTAGPAALHLAAPPAVCRSRPARLPNRGIPQGIPPFTSPGCPFGLLARPAHPAIGPCLPDKRRRPFVKPSPAIPRPLVLVHRPSTMALVSLFGIHHSDVCPCRLTLCTHSPNARYNQRHSHLPFGPQGYGDF